MREAHREVLYRGLKRLEKWMPQSTEVMICAYEDYAEKHGISWTSYMEAQGYRFCVFSFPALYRDTPGQNTFSLEDPWKVEHLVLLVFNDRNEIIADMAAMGMKTEDFLSDPGTYDYISEDSDWSYLAYMTLSGVFFDELEYPFCLADEEVKNAVRGNRKELFEGNVLIHTNSYVTKAYRRQGIFRMMTEMMHDHVLRYEQGNTTLYSSFALDPDVACYGPDTQKEPYIYSFEKDEPDRMRNKEILLKFGYLPLRLEEEIEDPESDGTKLWFAVKKEIEIVFEEERKN